MPTKLQDKQEELTAKRTALAEMFKAAGDDLDFTAEQLADVQTKNTEIEALGAEVEGLRTLDGMERKNREMLAEGERIVRPVPFASGHSDEAPVERKSIGDMFVESKAFTEYNRTANKGPAAELPMEFKTLLSEAAGFAPQAIRTGQVIDLAQQRPKVVDLIPQVTTDQIAVVYMRESTYTNAAAETAEGGTYPEAALAWTEVSQPVRKVAVFLPVTDEQLADINGMRDRINNRLGLMVRQRLDSQLVSGDGNAPNLLGLLLTPSIQTQAKGADPGPDAIFKAITLLQTVAFTDPSGIIMHPTDWQNVRLLKTSTGEYLFGDPMNETMPRLWGLTVATTTYMTAGTAVVADFANYTELAVRAGLEFEISNSHSDYFVKGQLAIRAQLRAAFCVLRANAIVKVTGL